jgi:hypothetical protein
MRRLTLVAMLCLAGLPTATAQAWTPLPGVTAAKAAYVVSKAELMHISADGRYYGPVSQRRRQQCYGYGIQHGNLFGVFKCVVTGARMSGRTVPRFNVWVRRFGKESFCVSTLGNSSSSSGNGVCYMGPGVPNDPRRCTYAKAPLFGPYTRSDGCSVRHARAAWERSVGVMPASALCLPTPSMSQWAGDFVYLCSAPVVGTWRVEWRNRVWSVTRG